MYPEGDAAERAAVIAEHKSYTMGLLWFLRTDKSVPQNVRQDMSMWGLCADEFQDSDHFPFQLYVREARRMLGAIVVTEKDMRDKHQPGSSSLESGVV